jgi:glycosyltransferase involved in cell wall biosynthesis
MRIGQLLTTSTGGIGRHVASVATRLVERGHQVRICCPPATAAGHGLESTGAEVLPLSQIGRLATADVVHAHGYKAGALAVPLARTARVPLVVSWHNAILGSGPHAVAGRSLQRLVAHTADVTLAASRDLVAEARRVGARDARLGQVAAPVLAAPVLTREIQRRQLGVTPSDILIITVSRLAPQKNLAAVLDVAREVRERNDLQFRIVGEGPLRPELENRIAAEGLHAWLLGHRTDVASLLAAADIALLTSTWEARPLVAQEALLAGVPLLATRVGGIEDLAGDAAALVPPGDLAALVRELLALADDPERRKALAAAGRVQAETWPDEDQVVDDLLAVYAEAARYSVRGRNRR